MFRLKPLEAGYWGLATMNQPEARNLASAQPRGVGPKNGVEKTLRSEATKRSEV